MEWILLIVFISLIRLPTPDLLTDAARASGKLRGALWDVIASSLRASVLFQLVPDSSQR